MLVPLIRNIIVVCYRIVQRPIAMSVIALVAVRNGNAAHGSLKYREKEESTFSLSNTHAQESSNNGIKS